MTRSLFPTPVVVTGTPPILQNNSSGSYIVLPKNSSSSAATGAATEDVTYYTPIYLANNCTLDRIGFRSGTHTSNGDVRLGIYENSLDNIPSNLILDAGVVNVTVASTYEITISQELNAGWYWLAINRQSGDFQIFRTPASTGAAMFSQATNDLSNAVTNPHTASGYQQTGVTGAFANAGTLTSTTQPSIAAVRIA
jgi:hypothetical protein